MSKLIAIDNGHGYNTAGKRVPDGSMREWEFNYATAKYLKAELENNNFRTLMVSDTRDDTPLATRASRINNAKADMSISIHANANTGTWGSANGIETFAYSTTSKGNAIAKLVQAELIKDTGLRDRGVKYNSLYMTRQPSCPAILVECGFMDNKTEATLLKSDDYRRKCAKAMCKAICKYYGVAYKSPSQNQQSTPITNNNNNNFKPYLAKCNANNLNCRKGAGTSYAVERQINKGTVVTIVEEKMVNGVKWGRAKSNYWISLSYMTFVRYV